MFPLLKSSSCPHFHLLFRFKKQSAAPIIRGHIWGKEKRVLPSSLLPPRLLLPSRTMQGGRRGESAAVSPPSAILQLPTVQQTCCSSNRASVFLRCFLMLSSKFPTFLKRSMEKWRITTYRPTTLFFFSSILVLPLLCCVVGRMGGRGRWAIFHFTNRQLRSERGKPPPPSFLPPFALPALFCVGYRQRRSNTDPGIREQESGLGYGPDRGSSLVCFK